MIWSGADPRQLVPILFQLEVEQALLLLQALVQALLLVQAQVPVQLAEVLFQPRMERMERIQQNFRPGRRRQY